MKLAFKLTFVLLLIFGIFLRIWRLDNTPIELFGDEIDVGLQAHSVLTTGSDYLGNTMPILFRSFSEYRLPMQLYLDVPFIKLFGLNEIGVRTPVILMGFLTILLFYFLVKEVFSKRLAIIAVVFLLYSPWHFNFSRQANDAGILLPLVVGGTLFFIKGIKNYKFLFLSVVFFALSIYSYAIATLFIPIFVVSLVIIFRKEVFKISFARLFLVGIIGIIIILPYINFMIKGKTSQRFSSIAEVTEDKVMQEVVDKRRWSNSLLTRVFYNNKTVPFELVLKNYVRTMSFNFLFTEGDPNMRQGVEGLGQMYRFDLVLVFLGVIFVLTRLPKEADMKKYYILFLVWLMFAPLPSVLTEGGGNHASRLILMLPPLILLSSFGFDVLIKGAVSNKGKIVFGFFAILMILDITRFFHRYFVVWRNESWRFWQYGFKEAITYVKENESKFDRIYFNNTYEPILGRFLFWYGYDMRLFQEEFKGDVHIENIVEGLNGFKLGEKYYFGELEKPIEHLADSSSLVVASAEKDATNPQIFNESNLKLLKTVISPTGIPIFYIFTRR